MSIDLQMRVLRILEGGEPLNLHEIAHALIATGEHPTADDIIAAIEGLRAKGYGVVEYEDGVDTRYWLDDGGMAA